jgi:hypothetical protein
MATLVERFGDDERFEGMVFVDGYDDAFIGLGWRFHDGPVAVYDRERIMEMLMEGGSSFDEAMEHFETNIIGWVGEFTPMFVVVADGKKIRDEGIYF